MVVTILLFWSRESCEHALPWGKEDTKKSQRDGKELDRGRKVVEWANPFHSIAVLFPVFAISPSKRPVACVQTSPLPQKKSGEETFFLSIFFWGRGDVCTQARGLQWLVCAAQWGRGFEAPDLERGIHFRGVF